MAPPPSAIHRPRPGRPPIDDPRSVVVGTRVTESEYEGLVAAAAERGETVSSHVRYVLVGDGEPVAPHPDPGPQVWCRECKAWVRLDDIVHTAVWAENEARLERELDRVAAALHYEDSAKAFRLAREHSAAGALEAMADDSPRSIFGLPGEEEPEQAPPGLTGERCTCGHDRAFHRRHETGWCERKVREVAGHDVACSCEAFRSIDRLVPDRRLRTAPHGDGLSTRLVRNFTSVFPNELDPPLQAPVINVGGPFRIHPLQQRFLEMLERGERPIVISPRRSSGWPEVFGIVEGLMKEARAPWRADAEACENGMGC